MKITRHGAERHRGAKSIWLDKPTVAWDDINGCVAISQRGIPEFETDERPFAYDRPSRTTLTATSTRHKYLVHLSLDEVRAVLKAVCDGAVVKRKRETGRPVTSRKQVTEN
jgi:hypothetical protein